MNREPLVRHRSVLPRRLALSRGGSPAATHGEGCHVRARAGDRGGLPTGGVGLATRVLTIAPPLAPAPARTGESAAVLQDTPGNRP